jgi:uncharacterized damage-inducible protein DinB
MRPGKNDYFPYLETYISKVKEDAVVSALENSLSRTLNLLKGIPSEKWNFAYGPDKWSVKELVVHTIDTERVFAYRALAFARGETQLLPAFDENAYAKHSDANSRTAEAILEELKNVRTANISLFRGFSDQMLQRSGKVPAGSITVNALGYAICGHTAHHLDVLTLRYLK